MLTTVKTLHDATLGAVVFRKNSRARQYILRLKQDEVVVTIPRNGNYRFAEAFFKKNRPVLIQKKTDIRPEEQPEHDEAALRRQAKAYLPAELSRLAQAHGFQYAEVNIRKSKTRWGSCSSKKNINLSLFLMLLPPHLIEYVLLHELCHTIEMNHSQAFWNLLDRHTGGKAKALKKEIRGWRILR